MVYYSFTCSEAVTASRISLELITIKKNYIDYNVVKYLNKKYLSQLN